MLYVAGEAAFARLKEAAWAIITAAHKVPGCTCLLQAWSQQARRVIWATCSFNKSFTETLQICCIPSIFQPLPLLELQHITQGQSFGRQNAPTAMAEGKPPKPSLSLRAISEINIRQTADMFHESSTLGAHGIAWE